MYKREYIHYIHARNDDQLQLYWYRTIRGCRDMLWCGGSLAISMNATIHICMCDISSDGTALTILLSVYKVHKSQFYFIHYKHLIDTRPLSPSTHIYIVQQITRQTQSCYFNKRIEVKFPPSLSSLHPQNKLLSTQRSLWNLPVIKIFIHIHQFKE